jgi:hypothetical protein
MDTHLALQARIHDYNSPTPRKEEEEEGGKEAQTLTDANEEKGDLDIYESSAEAEVQVHTGSNEEESEPTNPNANPKAIHTSKKVEQVRESGGHTAGEVWTESPHFLWGL